MEVKLPDWVKTKEDYEKWKLALLQGVKIEIPKTSGEYKVSVNIKKQSRSMTFSTLIP